MHSFGLLVLFSTFAVVYLQQQSECRDLDNNCRDWVAANADSCEATDYIKRSCRKSCGQCGQKEPKYDLRRLPSELQPLSFLVGKWRSEHGGKAIFPTIPKFTYGEEIEISIPDDSMQAQKALNYTAFAWSIGEKDELHSEYGYIAVKPNTREAALTTVMNNATEKAIPRTTCQKLGVSPNQATFRAYGDEWCVPGSQLYLEIGLPFQSFRFCYRRRRTNPRQPN